MILDAVDEPAPGASSYRRVINMIQWAIFALFLFYPRKASGRGGRSRSRWGMAYFLVQSA
jgi:hypothetical protein